MPELPEVETVKNVLKKSILNKKINSIEIIYPKIIDLGDINSLINEEFIDIKRKGKFLIFETNNHYLVSHLRMEGKYFIKDNNLPIEKHEHIIFRFNDFSLRYHDTRKFGRMEIVNKNDLNKTPINNLGVDPIIDKINIDEIYPKFNKKMPIKTLLLDQSIICGIGNIYVDEVLFLSKIDPNRLGNTIKLNELELIVKNTIKILKESYFNEEELNKKEEEYYKKFGQLWYTSPVDDTDPNAQIKEIEKCISLGKSKEDFLKDKTESEQQEFETKWNEIN